MIHMAKLTPAEKRKNTIRKKKIKLWLDNLASGKLDEINKEVFNDRDPEEIKTYFLEVDFFWEGGISLGMRKKGLASGGFGGYTDLRFAMGIDFKSPWDGYNIYNGVRRIKSNYRLSDNEISEMLQKDKGIMEKLSEDATKDAIKKYGYGMRAFKKMMLLEFYWNESFRES